MRHARRIHPLSLALASSLLVPFASARDRFVVSDTGATTSGTDDRIWILEDLTADGDFNDAGEVVAFYDENLGGVAISNGNGVKVGADGSVFVCDSTLDIVVRLRDLDGDGDANDAGEVKEFFHSGTNAQGIVMDSALNLCVDASGIVWVASSGVSGGGGDMILRLEDLNADGDADDAFESRVYYAPPGASGGDSLPTAVVVGPDGFVYYVEAGGAQPKGVYRLTDLDASGVIDAPAEVTPYFIPTAGAATAFHWCVRFDAQGFLYLNDTGNERLWRGKDLDTSGSIDAVTEAAVWYVVGAASNIWELAFAADGSVFAAEDQTPDRILHLTDTDASGTVTGTEIVEVYSDLVSATNIVSPRSIDAYRPAIVGGPYCAADGVDASVTTPCPCANTGGIGRGCASSFNASGASITASGSTALDDVVLTGDGMQVTGVCVFLQGDLVDPFGFVFGDGITCTGGALVRLRGVSLAGGSASFPVPPETITLSQRGGVTVGSGALRSYTVYYRNAAAAFCPPATFNAANSYRIVW